ncbi:adhesion G protein-coupled receptor B2 [Trichonephila clavipes]|nr:adhesion G protein-coupled receptor B2 [Trichonephila clavipes]
MEAPTDNIESIKIEALQICQDFLGEPWTEISISEFQFSPVRNEKVSNHGSIPITFDCNVVAFVVFEEGFHQPIKRTKQSVFLDVTVFRHNLWISFTPNAAVLFVDVAIQPEVRFIAKQNSLMKIGNNGNLVLGPFDESCTCVSLFMMYCQTKLRINHLTAVKSVAILEKAAENSLSNSHSPIVPCSENQVAVTLVFGSSWLPIYCPSGPCFIVLKSVP